MSKSHSEDDKKSTAASASSDDAKQTIKPLSAARKSFLAIDSYNVYSYQLSVSELKDIVAHMNKKHGIKIIINGETPKGQELIETNGKIIFDKIEKYTGNLKYVNFLLLETDPIYRYSSLYELVQKAISKFLKDSSGKSLQLKDNLSLTELTEVNTLISQLSCVPHFEQHIQWYLDRLYNQKVDYCVPVSKIPEEVAYIQNTLKENDVVGYVFTNNKRSNKDHFEALIITKKMIIKPVDWHIYGRSVEVSSYATTPILSETYPQADQFACGTLATLYLKELLKNNHKQLDEFCLQFSYYNKRHDNNIELRNGFFPSPQILRYSQSKAYNEYIEKMLGDTDSFEVVRAHRSNLTGQSLKKTLTDSMALAKEKNDIAVYEANKKLLDALPAFIEKWLGEYKNADTKRKQMDDVHGMNRYLSYRSHKLSKLKAPMEDTKDDAKPSDSATKNKLEKKS